MGSKYHLVSVLPIFLCCFSRRLVGVGGQATGLAWLGFSLSLFGFRRYLAVCMQSHRDMEQQVNSAAGANALPAGISGLLS